MTVIDLTNVPATQKVAVANPDGTTPLNVVLVASGGTPDSYGAGVVDAGTQRMTQASDSPLVAVSGTTAGAAVITDIAGTIQQYLRGTIVQWAAYLARIPASLGAKTSAASFSTTNATDDVMLGALTETAPATDTASSGLNGRAQRIAQRITSLIALVPASLGIKTSAGSFSTVVASDDVMIGALTETAPATDTASSGLNGRAQRIAQRITSLIALIPTALGQGTMATSFKVVLPSDQAAIPTKGVFVTVTTQFTRPADTNVYAAEDMISDSTSAPTAFTSTGAGRTSGGAGIITDAVIGMSTKAATPLQGEVWIFDQSFTNVNDNAAFSLSDADRDKLVGIIPFTCNSNGGLNYAAAVTGLNIGFTCIGTANLRFAVKAINAYTPASGEVFTLRLKIVQVD